MVRCTWGLPGAGSSTRGSDGSEAEARIAALEQGAAQQEKSEPLYKLRMVENALIYSTVYI